MIYSYDGTFFGYLSAVIDRDEALLRKDQAQPAVRADIFDLGQAIVPQRGPAHPGPHRNAADARRGA